MLPRQSTLEASITWSHDLLSGPERLLLRRLSVFSGGCILDAAEAVCSDDDLVPALSVLDLLDRLVSQSLVVLDDRCEPPRYRLLDTVRQYGARRLEESGEADAIRDRLLDLHLDRFGAPSFAVVMAGVDPAVIRLASWERDNILLVLDHAAARGRWDDYVALANGYSQWLGVERPDQALALLERIPDAQHRSRALRSELIYKHALLLFLKGDPRGFAELQEALTLSADGAHPYLFAWATQTMLSIAAMVHPGLAESLLDGAATVARDFGDAHIEMHHTFAGLTLRAVQGDGDRSRPYLEQIERLRGVVPNSLYLALADGRAVCGRDRQRGPRERRSLPRPCRGVVCRARREDDRTAHGGRL